MGSVTYNTGRVNIRYVYRATNGGTTFSENLVGTAFDYFLDSPQVNDAIYFGAYVQSVAGIELDPQVAMAGTDVVLKWEYYAGPHTGGSGWFEIPNLTDNTSGFTVTGTNLMVYFPIPPFQRYLNIAGNAYFQGVRCRLVSFTSITEGGQNAAVTPQHGDGYVRLADYSEESPASLEDIYDYMSVNYPEVGMSYLDASKKELWFGDAKIMADSSLKGFLKMRNETLKYGNGSYNFGINATGLLVGDKVGDSAFKNPCTIIYSGNSGGNIWTSGVHTKCYGLTLHKGVYSKEIDGIERTVTGTGYFGTTYGEYIGVNSYIGNTGYWSGAGLTLKNCFLHTGMNVTYSFASGQVFENVFLFADTVVNGLMYFFTGSSGDSDLVGLKWHIPAGSSLFRIYSDHPSEANLRFLNPSPVFPELDGDPKYLSTEGYPNNTNWNIWESYTLDLTVQDSLGNPIEGAAVTCVDNLDSSQDFSVTTNASGAIDQQKLLRSHGYSDGSQVIKQNHFYHTLTISAPGYQTKTVVLTVDRKREEVVVLEKTVPMISAMGKTKLVNMKPSDGQNSVMWKELDTKLA